jgi:hypothetical protein
MSKISIEVTGVTYWEARELAELLKKLEGVESTSVPWKTRDRAHDPDRLGLIILASTEAHKILVGLSLFIAAEYASGGIKEMGKEHYLELKKRILRKLGEWRALRPDEQRERIVFLFDDEHELIIADKDEAEPKP